ncbi:MAG: hypothetical protein Q8P68_01775 [Candidatus Peregrinibacteria bacterium]|nr:hypothetical protein [Candidatus Peregrinibacteria bacterium]MDZ4244490.1 hypothetical protein [Candidatus Gracilibacteria bacterium]
MKIPTQVSVSNFRKDIAKYHKMAIDGKPVMVSKSWNHTVLVNFHLYEDLFELLEELLNGMSISHAIQDKRSKDFHKRVRELGFNKNYTQNFGVDEPRNNI